MKLEACLRLLASKDEVLNKALTQIQNQGKGQLPDMETLVDQMVGILIHDHNGLFAHEREAEEAVRNFLKDKEDNMEIKIEARARLVATAVEVKAAKHFQVRFKDGSEHEVLFFADPTKHKGSFSARVKKAGLPQLKFRKGPDGKYYVCPWTKGVDAKWFPTGESDAQKAYNKSIKKYWKT